MVRLNAHEDHIGHVRLNFSSAGRFVVGLGIGRKAFESKGAGGWTTVDVAEPGEHTVDVPVGLSDWLDALSPGQCSEWYPLVGVKDADTGEVLMDNYRVPDKYEVQVCA